MPLIHLLGLYSPECVEDEFCELRRDGVLRSWGYFTRPVPSPDGPPTRGSGHGALPSPIRCPSALGALRRVPYCPSRPGPHLSPRQPVRSAGRDSARLSSDASRRPYLPPALSSRPAR